MCYILLLFFSTIICPTFSLFFLSIHLNLSQGNIILFIFWSYGVWEELFHCKQRGFLFCVYWFLCFGLPVTLPFVSSPSFHPLSFLFTGIFPCLVAPYRVSFIASSLEVPSALLRKPQEILGLSLPRLSNGKLMKQKKQKELVWIIYKSALIFRIYQCISAIATVYFHSDTAWQFFWEKGKEGARGWLFQEVALAFANHVW